MTDLRLKSPVTLVDHDGRHEGTIWGRSFVEEGRYDIRLADRSIRTNVPASQLREPVHHAGAGI
jgi:hypothetical protein